MSWLCLSKLLISFQQVLKTWLRNYLLNLDRSIDKTYFLGTNQRWEVVASFINQHTKTPEVTRNAKETLGKAKELQQGDFHLVNF